MNKQQRHCSWHAAGALVLHFTQTT